MNDQNDFTSFSRSTFNVIFIVIESSTIVCEMQIRNENEINKISSGMSSIVRKGLLKNFVMDVSDSI